MNTNSAMVDRPRRRCWTICWRSRLHTACWKWATTRLKTRLTFTMRNSRPVYRYCWETCVIIATYTVTGKKTACSIFHITSSNTGRFLAYSKNTLMQWRGVRRLSVRPFVCLSVNFCANRFFSQTNGRITTKLVHDGLQVSVHPGCAQGQGQGQRSRDTGTFLDSWNELLHHWWSG